MEFQNEQKRKPIVKLRAVLKVGSSYYISIPPEFMKRHEIKKGDKLPVLAGQIMKVIPMNEE
jgi:bifunctional DNA-binding transcriptional regulator/antitoxin component of YhaV-PrlF toxin-antitoxin module